MAERFLALVTMMVTENIYAFFFREGYTALTHMLQMGLLSYNHNNSLKNPNGRRVIAWHLLVFITIAPVHEDLQILETCP